MHKFLLVVTLLITSTIVSIVYANDVPDIEISHNILSNNDVPDILNNAEYYWKDF